MAAIEFRILGPLEADVGGRPVRLGGQRPRLALAALLLEIDRVVGVDRLVRAVWGEEPPPSARGLVSVHISALRKAFVLAGCDDDVIETVSGGYRVRSEIVRLDAREADDLVASARANVAGGHREEALSRFREALDLWRARVPAVSGTAPIDTGVARLVELRLVAFEEWAELGLALGRHRELIDDLTAVVADQPLRERPRAQLMLALWRSDRSADALDVYTVGRRLLVDELGLDPGQTLRDLQQAILRDDPHGLAPTGAGDRRRGDRAETRLIRPAELPPSASAFVGRDAALAVLDRMLASLADSSPVAILSGLGGVGKTALALHWAHGVADRFDGGELFADLRGHDDRSEPVTPGAVLERFLRALGVSGDRIPIAVDERAALFRSTLDGRRVLILLDNAASAAQVRPLLPGSPGCLVVVTARRRLEGMVASNGAVVVPVEVMDGGEAVELVARVAGEDRVAHDESAAARLGALCEGLPLAMRVAVARLASRPAWTLADLVSRLEGERGRLDQLSQGGLQVRGSFELSYRDLPAAAVLAFRRLGLVDMPGGFAPWLLAALLDDTVPEAEGLCEQLVDAQLVQPLGRDAAGLPRYRLHDLVRLFARERAEAEEPEDERDSALGRAFGALFALAGRVRDTEHGDTVLARIHGDIRPWLPRDDQFDDAVAWFETERSNVVAAILHTERLGWVEQCWSLVSRFLFMFETHAYYDDWRTVTDRALAACRRVGDRRGEASMLYSLGALRLHKRQIVEAGESLGVALELFTDLGDRSGVAVVLRHLATVHTLQGDHERGLRGLERALEMLVELGDTFAEAHTLGFIAQIHMLEGRLREAERLVDRAMSLLPVRGGLLEAQLLKRVGEVYRRQGRGNEAVAVCERSLELLRHRNDLIGEAYVLHALGEARHELGEYAEAEAVLGEALRTSRLAGERLIEGRILLALGQLGTPDARCHLERAVETFEALGAGTWHATATAALDEYVGQGRHAQG